MPNMQSVKNCIFGISFIMLVLAIIDAAFEWLLKILSGRCVRSNIAKKTCNIYLARKVEQVSQE